MPADQHVVRDAQVTEQLDVLKRSSDARRGDPVGWQPGQVLAAEVDASRARTLQATDAVEQRRFACTVRPDQRDDLALGNVQVDAVEGGQAAKRR